MLSRAESADPNSWISGHDILSIPLPDDPRARLEILSVPRPWPDDPGDPKTDPELFAARSLAFLGPLTYPGNLRRALYSNGARNQAVASAFAHRGFVLLRTTHLSSTDPTALTHPKGLNTRAELDFMTSVAHALLVALQPAAYFNPAGETLHDTDSFAAELELAARESRPPLGIWCGVRRSNPSGDAAAWVVMDTVGLEQLETLGPDHADTRGAAIVDHEACWPRARRFDPAQVWTFLLNAGLYTADNGPIIRDGDTMDGAGTRWRASLCTQSIMPRPRPTLRWFPLDEHRVPDSLASGPTDAGNSYHR